MVSNMEAFIANSRDFQHLTYLHQVISIQMHHTPLNVAQCGDVVGVHLKGNVDKCERGDILSDTRSAFTPPVLAAVDLATGALKSSVPIQYCDESLSDCPMTLAFQP